MPNAAVAADIYKHLIGNVNPIQAFTQGAELRARLDTIAANQQAQSFQGVLDSVKMADQRSQDKMKMELANRELDLRVFNANTNRMNATRGLQNAAGKGSASGGITPIFSQGEDGKLMLTFPTKSPGDGGDASQTPTDVTAVQPLTNGTPEPKLPNAPPAGVTGPSAALFPTTAPAQPPTAPAGPQQASAPAPAAASPMGAAPAATNPGGYFASSLRTDKNMQFAGATFTYQEPKTGKPVMNPEALNNLKNFAATWGLKPEKLEMDEKGLPKITFAQENASKSDFSVSSLPAEAQKQALPMMTELGTLAEGVRSATPTNAQKMAYVGVTDPNLMTDELWREGYTRAMQKGDVDPQPQYDLSLKAREFAAFMNLQFNGKAGYVPSTEATVLSSLNIAPVVPPGAQTQAQPTTASAGAKPRAGEGTVLRLPAAGAAPAGPQPAAGAASAGSAAPATSSAQPPSGVNAFRIAGLEQTEIPKLEGKAAAAKTEPEKLAANQALAEAKKQLADLKAANPPLFSDRKVTISQTPVTAEAEIARAKAISSSVTPKPVAEAQARSVKTEQAKRLWESKKLILLRVLNDTGANLDEMDKLDPKTNTTGADVWFQKNKDKLIAAGIASSDGDLKVNSPLFTNEDGRSITFAHVFSALLSDPRFRDAKKSSLEAPGGRPVTISVGKPVQVK